MPYQLRPVREDDLTIDLHVDDYDDLDSFCEDLVELKDVAKPRSPVIRIDLSRPLFGLSIPLLFRRVVQEIGPTSRTFEILVQAEAVDSLYRYLPKQERIQRFFQLPQSKLLLTVADITDVEAEAIVNTTNSRLVLGGGVSGSIAKIVSPALQRRLLALAGNGVSPGDVVLTASHGLPCAEYILHAVTADGEMETIRKAMQEILKISLGKGLRSVAVPALGGGTGGLQMVECARIMLEEIFRTVAPRTDIIVVLWTKSDFDVFSETASTSYEKLGCRL